MARTGRPKKSRDIPCTCRECGIEWTVPEWQKDGRDFCSRACYFAYRRKFPVLTYKPPDEKVCPRCGRTFLVGGAGRPRRQQVFCSLACAGKSSAPKARYMRPTDRAWLAGVFDGEGNICQPRPQQEDSVRISISNTCLPFLERVQRVAGTGSLHVTHEAVGNHSKCWVWQSHSDNARALLRQMLPWLIVKKEKAMTAINPDFDN